MTLDVHGFREHLVQLVGGEWVGEYLLVVESRDLFMHLQVSVFGGREIGERLHHPEIKVYVYNRLRLNDKGEPSLRCWTHDAMLTSEDYKRDREDYTGGQLRQIQTWLDALPQTPVSYEDKRGTHLWAWAHLPVPDHTAMLLRSIGAEPLSREDYTWRHRPFSSPWQLGEAVYEIFHVAGIPPRLPLQACELGSNEDARAYLARVRRQVDQYELILRTLRR